jgi:hypothetical protein
MPTHERERERDKVQKQLLLPHFSFFLVFLDSTIYPSFLVQSRVRKIIHAMYTVLQRDYNKAFQEAKHTQHKWFFFFCLCCWTWTFARSSASLVDERDALLDALGQLFLCLLKTSPA